MKGYNTVCAKRNIVYAAGVTSLGDSPHHLRLVATSFICAASGNDVLASLEMMLTFGQMMLCLTAQMKKSKSCDLDFLFKGYEKDIF